MISLVMYRSAIQLLLGALIESESSKYEPLQSALALCPLIELGPLLSLIGTLQKSSASRAPLPLSVQISISEHLHQLLEQCQV